MKHAHAPDAQRDELDDLRRLDAAVHGLPIKGVNGPGNNPPVISDTPGPGWSLHRYDVEEEYDDKGDPKGHRYAVDEGLEAVLAKHTDDELGAKEKVAALGLSKARLARLRAVANGATETTEAATAAAK